MKRSTVAAVVLSLAVAAPVWAGETRTNQVQALKDADHQLSEAEQGAGKPAHAQVIRQQRQQVQDLLDQLQAGRRVDPSEVDRVLRQAEQPF